MSQMQKWFQQMDEEAEALRGRQRSPLERTVWFVICPFAFIVFALISMVAFRDLFKSGVSFLTVVFAILSALSTAIMGRNCTRLFRGR